MPFNTEIRNKLASMVGNARNLLRKEFQEQLQELYGIQPDGRITTIQKLTHLDDEQLAVASLLRTSIEYIKSDEDHENNPSLAAIERLLYEQSFTILNRFAALRLCEERGIFQECIRNGMQSKGFQVYLKITGSSIGDRFQRYRTFLLCLFDEISIDLGVLFDRFSKEGLLFPREKALTKLLEIINEQLLSNIWNEDETIGWIYQYFNSQEERKKLRKASSTPRNSHELAVRNQFFTPRYVVQFLTDNTLGRIWYEMRKGKTCLVKKCEYFVRRSKENFLKEDECSPEPKSGQEDLTQGELLKLPVHIPYREKKDPREIKIFDPACGSGHFLLYAFDLLETIYIEAWDDPDLNKPIQKDFFSLENYRKIIPDLILKHNLYGIDIDSRCIQICSLSLWLRAQRTYKELGLPFIERPEILKNNIVTAEPMPGNKELIEEFTKKLVSPAIGQLVHIVFNKMKIAGEAGSLLKIEEEIQSAVSEAKAIWKQQPQSEQFKLFAEMEVTPIQGKLSFDFSGITNEQFWEKAEEQIYSVLNDYAELADINTIKRRLFAKDSARGFAFIDLMRLRFDVILMNPPFGESINSVFEYINKHFPYWNKNLACAFISRMIDLLEPFGFIGSVYDKTIAIKTTYQNFRKQIILNKGRLKTQVDLGWEVLDANVEVSSAVISSAAIYSPEVFFDITSVESDSKKDILASSISEAYNGNINNFTFLCNPSEFISLPNAVFAFQFPPFVHRWFVKYSSLSDVGFTSIVGHSFKAERHFRLFWELQSPKEIAFNKHRWTWVFNGGEYSPYYHPERDIVLYGSNGDLIRSHESVTLRNLSLHGKYGVGYGKRGEFIDAQVLPPGHVYTVEGEGSKIETRDDAFYFTSLLNSHIFQFVINLYCGQHKYPGYVNIFPSPSPSHEEYNEVIKSARAIYEIKALWQRGDETDMRFLLPRIFNYSYKNISVSLEECIQAEQKFDESISAKTETIESAFELIYKLSKDEREIIKRYVSNRTADKVWLGGPIDHSIKKYEHVNSIISYFIGCIFGRWEIMHATSDKEPPDLREPYSAIPICSDGMLQDDTGLPLERANLPDDYPLRISWNGILVDDPDHGEDIIRRIHDVMSLIWKNSTFYVEQEICQVLNVASLRDYIRNPNKFFADHLRCYSKSRRQTPIYWQLSTKSGTYSILIYYQCLNDQTLFTCLADFINPKLKDISKDIERLEKKLEDNKSTSLQKKMESLLGFRQELINLRNEIIRITKLPYEPNLDDGVLITASPLWKLFQHKKWSKDLKYYWDRLEAGDFDWAHLAYSIWTERVKEKCKSDKSLAIAHGLEDLYKGS